jgi:hypothetical protein
MDELKQAYKACGERNSGEAYRRFHSSTVVSSTHDTVLAAMRHKFTGGIIILMAAAGLIGLLMSFWPR